jgi:hypothetical protein
MRNVVQESIVKSEMMYSQYTRTILPNLDNVKLQEKVLELENTN